MCYHCKHEKKYNLYFSKLGLTKGVLIKICFIGAGVALENLPYDLSDYLSVPEHLVKDLIIWDSFYWDVARILRDIIIIIRYILDQLFFMPCGVTCQIRSKEVPINDWTWRFRYSLYYGMYRSIERYFAANMNFWDIFYWKPYNETLWIISSVYVVLALLFER